MQQAILLSILVDFHRFSCTTDQGRRHVRMVSFYDELEIEDFAWDDDKQVFHYPCPCGDRFEITRAQLGKGEDVATCPSCSLIVRVVYDMMDYEDSESEEEEVLETVIQVI